MKHKKCYQNKARFFQVLFYCWVFQGCVTVQPYHDGAKFSDEELDMLSCEQIQVELLITRSYIDGVQEDLDPFQGGGGPFDLFVIIPHIAITEMTLQASEARRVKETWLVRMFQLTATRSEKGCLDGNS